MSKFKPPPREKPKPTNVPDDDDMKGFNPHRDLNEPTWKTPLPLGNQFGPEFPTDTLPTWLRLFVEALSIFTQTPAGLSGGMALVMIAIAVQKAFQVQPRPGWTEPLNIYWLGLAEPASRKSAIFQAMKTPLDVYERIQAERMAPEIRQKRTKFEILTKQRGEFINSVSKAKDTQEREHLLRQVAEIDEEIVANPVPTEPRKYVQDVTPEKFLTMMAQNDGRLGVIDSEGDFFDIIAGKYSAKGQSNTGGILKAWSGDDIRVDRGNRPSEHIRRPAATLGIVAQPAIFDGLLTQPTFRARGLMGRPLYDKPANNLGMREIDPPEIPFPVQDDYFRMMSKLLALPVQYGESGDIEPTTLTLSEGAISEFCEFRESIERELGDFGRLAHLRDWGGKIAGQVARLAGLLHLAECIAAGDVAEEIATHSMKAAIRLGWYYIDHATVMFTLMGENKSIGASKHILRVIRKSEFTTFTKRDLFEKVKGTFVKAEELDSPLHVLESHGYILDITPAPSGKAGRRPSPTYAVNPLLENDSHNSHNSPNGGAA